MGTHDMNWQTDPSQVEYRHVIASSVDPRTGQLVYDAPERLGGFVTVGAALGLPLLQRIWTTASHEPVEFPAIDGTLAPAVPVRTVTVDDT